MLKKYQDHIRCSFAYKLVCVDDKFSKPIVLYKGENAAYKFMNMSMNTVKNNEKTFQQKFDNNWRRRKFSIK